MRSKDEDLYTNNLISRKNFKHQFYTTFLGLIQNHVVSKYFYLLVLIMEHVQLVSYIYFIDQPITTMLNLTSVLTFNFFDLFSPKQLFAFLISNGLETSIFVLSVAFFIFKMLSLICLLLNNNQEFIPKFLQNMFCYCAGLLYFTSSRIILMPLIYALLIGFYSNNFGGMTIMVSGSIFAVIEICFIAAVITYFNDLDMVNRTSEWSNWYINIDYSLFILKLVMIAFDLFILDQGSNNGAVIVKTIGIVIILIYRSIYIIIEWYNGYSFLSMLAKVLHFHLLIFTVIQGYSERTQTPDNMIVNLIFSGLFSVLIMAIVFSQFYNQALKMEIGILSSQTNSEELSCNFSIEASPSIFKYLIQKIKLAWFLTKVLVLIQNMAIKQKELQYFEVQGFICHHNLICHDNPYCAAGKLVELITTSFKAEKDSNNIEEGTRPIKHDIHDRRLAIKGIALKNEINDELLKLLNKQTQQYPDNRMILNNTSKNSSNLIIHKTGVETIKMFKEELDNYTKSNAGKSIDYLSDNAKRKVEKVLYSVLHCVISKVLQKYYSNGSTTEKTFKSSLISRISSLNNIPSFLPLFESGLYSQIYDNNFYALFKVVNYFKVIDSSNSASSQTASQKGAQGIDLNKMSQLQGDFTILSEISLEEAVNLDVSRDSLDSSNENPKGKIVETVLDTLIIKKLKNIAMSFQKILFFAKSERDEFIAFSLKQKIIQQIKSDSLSSPNSHNLDINSVFKYAKVSNSFSIAITKLCSFTETTLKKLIYVDPSREEILVRFNLIGRLTYLVYQSFKEIVKVNPHEINLVRIFSFFVHKVLHINSLYQSLKEKLINSISYFLLNEKSKLVGSNIRKQQNNETSLGNERNLFSQSKRCFVSSFFLKIHPTDGQNIERSYIKETSDYGVIIVSGNLENQGKVLYTNKHFNVMFKFTSMANQIKQLNCLFPSFIIPKHNTHVEEFFKTGRSRHLNNIAYTFCVDANSNVILIDFYSCYFPNLNSGLMFIGIFQPALRYQRIIQVNMQQTTNSFRAGPNQSNSSFFLKLNEFENSNTAYLMLDSDLNIIYFSANFESYLDFSKFFQKPCRKYLTKHITKIFPNFNPKSYIAKDYLNPVNVDIRKMNSKRKEKLSHNYLVTSLKRIGKPASSKYLSKKFTKKSSKKVIEKPSILNDFIKECNQPVSLRFIKKDKTIKSNGKANKFKQMKTCHGSLFKKLIKPFLRVNSLNNSDNSNSASEISFVTTGKGKGKVQESELFNSYLDYYNHGIFLLILNKKSNTSKKLIVKSKETDAARSSSTLKYDDEKFLSVQRSLDSLSVLERDSDSIKTQNTPKFVNKTVSGIKSKFAAFGSADSIEKEKESKIETKDDNESKIFIVSPPVNTSNSKIIMKASSETITAQKEEGEESSPQHSYLKAYNTLTNNIQNLSSTKLNEETIEHLKLLLLNNDWKTNSAFHKVLAFLLFSFITLLLIIIFIIRLNRLSAILISKMDFEIQLNSYFKRLNYISLNNILEFQSRNEVFSALRAESVLFSSYLGYDFEMLSETFNTIRNMQDTSSLFSIAKITTTQGNTSLEIYIQNYLLAVKSFKDKVSSDSVTAYRNISNAYFNIEVRVNSLLDEAFNQSYAVFDSSLLPLYILLGFILFLLILQSISIFLLDFHAKSKLDFFVYSNSSIPSEEIKLISDDFHSFARAYFEYQESIEYSTKHLLVRLEKYPERMEEFTQSKCFNPIVKSDSFMSVSQNLSYKIGSRMRSSNSLNISKKRVKFLDLTKGIPDQIFLTPMKEKEASPQKKSSVLKSTKKSLPKESEKSSYAPVQVNSKRNSFALPQEQSIVSNKQIEATNDYYVDFEVDCDLKAIVLTLIYMLLKFLVLVALILIIVDYRKVYQNGLSELHQSFNRIFSFNSHFIHGNMEILGVSRLDMDTELNQARLNEVFYKYPLTLKMAASLMRQYDSNEVCGILQNSYKTIQCTEFKTLKGLKGFIMESIKLLDNALKLGITQSRRYKYLKLSAFNSLFVRLIFNEITQDILLETSQINSFYNSILTLFISLLLILFLVYLIRYIRLHVFKMRNYLLNLGRTLLFFPNSIRKLNKML